MKTPYERGKNFLKIQAENLTSFKFTPENKILKAKIFFLA